MEENKHLIAFALHSNSWLYGVGSKEQLEAQSTQVLPEDFTAAMKGKVYCPVCTTPLSRTPDLKNITTNAITAHYKHKPSFSHVNCRLKVQKKQGQLYKNEEQAKKAIENEELVIVSSWQLDPPVISDEDDKLKEYERTPVEDENGPETDVVIGRHNGEEFKLPSKIKNIGALCRNFDKNVHRAYILPESKNLRILRDALNPTSIVVDGFDKLPRLFFAKISNYRRLTYRNIIYVETPNFEEFKLYTYPKFDERKNIDSTKIGRYILFHSDIGWEGVDTPKSFLDAWGQYGLLPEKYEKYLPKKET